MQVSDHGHGAGGEPFEYQSCTHQHDIKGSMEGSFEFVEGTLSNPTGGFFDVEVGSHTILVKAAMHSNPLHEAIRSHHINRNFVRAKQDGWVVGPGLQA